MSFERYSVRNLKVKDAMIVTVHENQTDLGNLVDCFNSLLSPPATQMPQITVSRSKQNVIRGLHCSPHHKLVHCPTGKAFDVVVDMRPDSPTFLQWDAGWIDRTHHIVIPPFCAHGFFAAEDDTAILYLQGGCFAPELDFSVNYLDKRVNVEWPKPINADDYILSPKDRNNPFVDDAMIEKLRERTRNPLIGRQIAPYSDFAVISCCENVALPFFEVFQEKNLKAHLTCGNGARRDTFETEMIALRPKYGVLLVVDATKPLDEVLVNTLNIVAVCANFELPLAVIANKKQFDGLDTLKDILSKHCTNVTFVTSEGNPTKEVAAHVVQDAVDGKYGIQA